MAGRCGGCSNTSQGRAHVGLPLTVLLCLAPLCSDCLRNVVRHSFGRKRSVTYGEIQDTLRSESSKLDEMVKSSGLDYKGRSRLESLWKGNKGPVKEWTRYRLRLLDHLMELDRASFREQPSLQSKVRM